MRLLCDEIERSDTARIVIGPTRPQPAGDQRTQHPAPHRFVRDVEPTPSKEILHVPVAQRKAWVENARLTSLFSLSKEQAV